MFWANPGWWGSPNRAALDAAASGSSYQGPIDIYGTAVSAWGFRAMSAAYIVGNKHLVDLVDQAGLNPITIDCLSNGTFDAASYNAWVTAHTVTTPLVKQLYDQVSTNHLTQPTTANMPIFNGASGVISMSVLNSFSGAFINTGNFTQAQPLSVSVIVNRVTNTSAGNAAFLENGSTGDTLLIDSSLHVGSSGGGTSSNTVTLNTPSAVQFSLIGAGSKVQLDSTLTSSITSGPFSLSPAAPLYALSGSGVDTIKITEAGIWAGDKSANFSTVNSNQHTFWGF